MAAVHEQEILARSLVRVRTRSGQVVGAGFLVAADTVATCAHVVAEAAGEPGVPETPPDGPVHLDFPLLDGRAARAAVLTWRADADIALLRLDAPVPGGRPVHPADGDGARLWEHPFRALGFPASGPPAPCAARRARAGSRWRPTCPGSGSSPASAAPPSGT